MIAALRQRFNRDWTPDKFARLQALLFERAGVPVPFPLSETPCFFPTALIDEMAAIGTSLVTSFLADGDARKAAEALIPVRYLGPGQEALPTCVQVDFGLVSNADGTVSPKLVELQAFPSLYAFQHTLAEAHREAYTLPRGSRRTLAASTATATSRCCGKRSSARTTHARSC